MPARAVYFQQQATNSGTPTPKGSKRGPCPQSGALNPVHGTAAHLACRQLLLLSVGAFCKSPSQASDRKTFLTRTSKAVAADGVGFGRAGKNVRQWRRERFCAIEAPAVSG